MTTTSTMTLLDIILSVVEDSKNDFPSHIEDITFKISAFRSTVEYSTNNGILLSTSKMETLLRKRLAKYRGDKRSTHALQWTKKENLVTYLHYVEDDLLPL